MTQAYPTVDILAPYREAQTIKRYERVGATMAGVVLTGVAALSGRAAVRVLLGTAGGLLLARGLSGVSLTKLVAEVGGRFGVRRDLERRFNDGKYDIVDVASFDSFPASDPPSYSPGHG